MEKKLGKLSQTQWNLAGAALATLHYHVIKSSLGVGVSSSSCTVTTISARHNGQYCNWEAHFLQNPLWENYLYIFRIANWLAQNTHLCLHGSKRMIPFESKHNVHESSRTLNFRSWSRNMCRGNTILSCAFSWAWPLKLSNFRLCGGYRNGSEPKLKRHCWNDINEAAAKKPSLCKWDFFF